jgi:hypothetical protein
MVAPATAAIPEAILIMPGEYVEKEGGGGGVYTQMSKAVIIVDVS